jgi:hypothetical protein
MMEIPESHTGQTGQRGLRPETGMDQHLTTAPLQQSREGFILRIQRGSWAA